MSAALELKTACRQAERAGGTLAPHRMPSDAGTVEPSRKLPPPLPAPPQQPRRPSRRNVPLGLLAARKQWQRCIPAAAQHQAGRQACRQAGRRSPGVPRGPPDRSGCRRASAAAGTRRTLPAAGSKQQGGWSCEYVAGWGMRGSGGGEVEGMGARGVQRPSQRSAVVWRSHVFTAQIQPAMALEVTGSPGLVCSSQRLPQPGQLPWRQQW